MYPAKGAQEESMQ